MTVNYLKVGLAALVVVCLTVMIVAKAVDSAAGLGIIGTIVGYISANGVNARNGRGSAPMFQRKQQDDQGSQ